MKDCIQEYYSKVHRLYKRLRSALQEAWASIIQKRIKELIREISRRYEAVIGARGIYTKY